MLGAVGSLVGGLATGVAGAGSATASMIGSKKDSIINGPQKAMLVLHYTQPNASGGSAIGSQTGKFAGTDGNGVLANTQRMLAAEGKNTTMNGMSDFVLEVQYNPSSISLTANADSMPIKPLQPAFDASVPLSASVGPAVLMMIELIFDDIVVPDAFMYEKMNVSAGNIANDALLLAEAMRGQVHSVQPQTNALLAAMQRDETRTISLYWADFHFHGVIKDMQAKYTLFSVSGRPIRSVVNMTLAQDTVSGNNIINEYWEASLDALFPKGRAGMENTDTYSARTIAQQGGALTNINF